jgi:hypothetical protein
MTRFSGNFREAVRDYRFLLDRGYPVPSSLALVGNRWRLEKSERIILFRGVLPSALSRSNAVRRIEILPPDSRLAVDGYNVLFTISNYLAGHPVFIATDGFVRDAGGAHGSVGNEARFERAMEEMCVRLIRLEPSWVELFLDAPVSKSAIHAGTIRRLMEVHGIPGEVHLVPGADGPVAKWEGGYCATSDSAVIAKAASPVFDLAADILASWGQTPSSLYDFA